MSGFVDVVTQAQESLYDALAGVEGLVVVRRYGATAAPPAAVVAPPEVTWGAPGFEPTDATFEVAVLVADSDRVRTDLLRWLAAAVEALERVPDAVVRRAAPGTWPSGGADLPAYIVTVDYAL